MPGNVSGIHFPFQLAEFVVAQKGSRRDIINGIGHIDVFGNGIHLHSVGNDNILVCAVFNKVSRHYFLGFIFNIP